MQLPNGNLLDENGKLTTVIENKNGTTSIIDCKGNILMLMTKEKRDIWNKKK